MRSLAVIGAGAVGTIHARNVASNPRTALVAVCDPNRLAAERLAAPLGAPAVASVEDALALSPDAIVIASSTASHAAVACAAIAARTPFLCEKPLARDLAAAETIARRAKAAGLRAAMAFNRRFDAQYAAMRQAIRKGRIGAPETLRITSRSARPPTPEFIKTSGGLLGEKGSHFFDIARWICGESPVEVFAMGSVMIDPGYREVGEVDTAMISLRMPSGTLCHFDFGWRAAYGQDERLEVMGARGMLSTRQSPEGPILHQSAAGLLHPGKLPGWQDRFAPTYAAVLDAFVDRIEGPGAVDALARLDDGVAAQRLADAAARSLRDNRPVAVPSA